MPHTMPRVPMGQSFLVASASLPLNLLLRIFSPFLLPPLLRTQELLQLPIRRALIHTAVSQTPLVKMCSAQIFPAHTRLATLATKAILPRPCLTFLCINLCGREALPNLRGYRSPTSSLTSLASSPSTFRSQTCPLLHVRIRTRIIHTP